VLRSSRVIPAFSTVKMQIFCHFFWSEFLSNCLVTILSFFENSVGRKGRESGIVTKKMTAAAVA
jgi:hypothetical protein